MRKTTITLAALLLCFFSLNAQSCLPDGITLVFQEDVDSFAINYPDCRVIEGTLTIRNGGIDNLEALSQIDSILGNLLIRGANQALLKDFENLKYIGKTLKLESIGGDSLGGFKNLETIGESFLCEQVYAIKNFEGLNRLKTIGENFRISSSQNLENFKGLDSLNYIGGTLENDAPHKLHSFVGLENLDSIGGRLDIKSRNLTSYIGLESLRKIGGTFIIGNQETLTNLSGLENLREIGGTLWIQVNQELINADALSGLTHAPEINIVNNTKLESFDFRNVTNLKDFDISSCKKITSLENVPDMLPGSSFSISFMRQFTGKIPGNLVSAEYVRISSCGFNQLTGLENLETVEHNLSISDCDSLKNLSGLDNLRTVKRQLVINGDRLTGLEGLENITHIGELDIWNNDRLLSLSALKNLSIPGGNLTRGLSIIKNPLLKDLDGLQFVKKVSNKLKIEENIGLESLNGLENLKETEQDSTVLEILNNRNLENIEALNQFKFSNLKELIITENPKLGVCDYLEICNFLGTPTRPRTIASNAPGCQTEQEILDLCAQNFSEVYYQVFYDENQNGEKDATEPILPQIKMSLSPGDFSTFSGRNRPGISFLYQGDYVFSVDLPYPWESSTPDSVAFSVGQNSDTISFGIYPTELISELTPSIASNIVRCNTEVLFYANLNNFGTTNTDGILWLEADTLISMTTFIDVPDHIVGDSLFGWNFRDLVPGELWTKEIKFLIPGPPLFAVGDSLTFRSFAKFTDPNGSHDSEYFELKSEILCSYDPNDKLVSPNRSIQTFEPPRSANLTLFDEPLTYTVRFQNTGNAEAFDVVVRDTLDENLNPETFQFLSSSHYEVLNIKIENDRFLAFEFRDINLPDSTTNFDESQGYLSYRIRAKDGLRENTPINNTASIYFDFNPPIVTNTTESIMVSELPTSSVKNIDNQLIISIFPNPTTGDIFIKGDNLENAQITLTDLAGRILKQKKLNGRQEISLPETAKGMFFLKVETEEGIAVKRVVKI